MKLNPLTSAQLVSILKQAGRMTRCRSFVQKSKEEDIDFECIAQTSQVMHGVHYLYWNLRFTREPTKA